MNAGQALARGGPRERPVITHRRRGAEPARGRAEARKAADVSTQRPTPGVSTSTPRRSLPNEGEGAQAPINSVYSEGRSGTAPDWAAPPGPGGAAGGEPVPATSRV